MPFPDWSGFRPPPQITRIAFLLVALAGWGPELHAQNMVGTITELRADGTVRLDLNPGSEARAGILAFVVRFDEEVDEWFPLAEIAIESAGGGVGLGRILELGDDAALRPGDRIAVYEAIRDDEISLRVSPPQLEFLVGEAATLVAELVDADGRFIQTVGARWRSSNEGVATVSDDGQTIAVSVGEALIIGQGSGGVIAAATVRVVEPDLVIPDSIVVFMGVEEQVQIGLSRGTPRPVSPRSFRWSVDDPSIATIDAFGLLQPTGMGVTQIRFAGLNREGVIPVSVLGVPAEVQFFPRGEEIELVQGEAVRVSAAVRMADGNLIEGFTPPIRSPNELILDTHIPGEIRGRRTGDARVEASFAGSSTAWAVRVTPPAIDFEVPAAPLVVGQPFPLQASFRGTGGVDLGVATDVVWETSDAAVARIEQGELIPVGFGTALISATLGDFRIKHEVRVLGDLLLTLREGGRDRIHTLSFSSLQVAPLPGFDLDASQPSLSPDGRTLAFVARSERTARPWRVMLSPIGDPTAVTAVADEMGGATSARNFLFQEHMPAWSHDGRTLYFLSNRTGSYALYALDPLNPQLRRLTRGSEQHRSVGPSPGAPVLAVERAVGSGRGEVVLMLSDGSEAQAILGTGPLNLNPWGYGSPSLFADGMSGLVARWSTSDRRRGSELVLVEFGDSDGQHRMRTLVAPFRDHDLLFAPSPDGERIAYATTPVLGGETGTLALIDLTGRVLVSVPLPRGAELLDLSWTNTRGTR